ncbi:ATP-binding protein [Nostoc sp. DSM 114167]|uniref:ATP-binding protein n=1 Tax=Nostoc sp. DSM 114167 TaxID=3439050 RepID=UPI004045F615
MYRIVQEGLTNICKHAEATTVQLQIQTTLTELSLTLQDNGRGFCIDENQTGFGLQGMRERVLALAGQLEITSELSNGCKITAKFPRILLYSGFTSRRSRNCPAEFENATRNQTRLSSGCRS